MRKYFTGCTKKKRRERGLKLKLPLRTEGVISKEGGNWLTIQTG